MDTNVATTSTLAKDIALDAARTATAVALVYGVLYVSVKIKRARRRSTKNLIEN